MGEMNRAIALVVFDIDGVVRDVSNSYRRALADTVETFTEGGFRPSQDDIDALKSEGIWNNDWEASREFIFRYVEQQGGERSHHPLDYDALVRFFQSRYRGPDPDHWTGYICDEPLLMTADYLETLTQEAIAWGFFSGATRDSARFVLEQRLGLRSPTLVAMEDAPGKPDPTGLQTTVTHLEAQLAAADSAAALPVIYAGDTVADMQTVMQARSHHPERSWIGVGILPPHAQRRADYAQRYRETLMQAGATVVLEQVTALTTEKIYRLSRATSADFA